MGPTGTVLDRPTSERLAYLEGRIDAFSALPLDALGAMRADTAARFERIEKRIEEGFAAIDKRFDRLEQLIRDTFPTDHKPT
jgi:hypothetical protein